MGEKLIYVKNLKWLRKKHNMTQIELAEKLGINYSTISKWENGTHIPGSKAIAKVAKIFNVDWRMFMEVDLENYNGDIAPKEEEIDYAIYLPNDELDFIIDIRKLDDDHKQRLAEIIKFYLSEQKEV